MTIETEKNQRDKVNFVHQFNLDGSDIEYKTVGRGNASSGRVNLPKEWEEKGSGKYKRGFKYESYFTDNR